MHSSSARRGIPQILKSAIHLPEARAKALPGGFCQPLLNLLALLLLQLPGRDCQAVQFAGSFSLAAAANRVIQTKKELGEFVMKPGFHWVTCNDLAQGPGGQASADDLAPRPSGPGGCRRSSLSAAPLGRFARSAHVGGDRMEDHHSARLHYAAGRR